MGRDAGVLSDSRDAGRGAGVLAGVLVGVLGYWWWCCSTSGGAEQNVGLHVSCVHIETLGWADLESSGEEWGGAASWARKSE